MSLQAFNQLIFLFAIFTKLHANHMQTLIQIIVYLNLKNGNRKINVFFQINNYFDRNILK